MNLLSLLLMITSCCTKMDCDGVDEINEILLLNFSSTEVDTVIWMRFSKNSGFTIPVDSIITTASERGTDLVLNLKNKLDVAYDYQMYLPATASNYRLSGFKVSTEGCNNCFPFRPQSDYYNKLSSYEVNAVRQHGEQIVIYK